MAACSGNVLWRSFSHRFVSNYDNYRNLKQLCRRTARLSQSVILRTCVTNTESQDSGHSSFESMVRERRRQVRRSVLVHVYSKFVVGGLYNYCIKYGSISDAHYYSLPNEKDFVLLEFDNDQSVAALLGETKHFDSHNVIPVHSRCLWYHETSNSKEDGCPAHIKTSAPLTDADIAMQLRAATSVSNQMSILHEGMKLTDLQQRLRFFACLQIEMAFSSLFANCTVLPFGSSVNGFGKNNCDLDMVMSLDDDRGNQITPNTSTKLYFHTKRSLANNRVQTQRHLESISDVIHSFFPGCSSVHRILQARVPIIKFQHELINSECDLTMSNLSGVYMSELLFLYGEMDDRVRPLVTVVLKWAKENGLTQISPGRWVTNFSLILMVLFFLQARTIPILPSFGVLQQLAVAADKRTSEGIDCSFVRNLERFPVMNSPAEFGDLLLEFFAFYANFDFKRFGISLGKGVIVTKSDYSALYIQNPLERDLNVSKNVSAEEVERLQGRMKLAAAALEASAQPCGQEVWGLLKLFDVTYVGNNQRTFPVSAFFDSSDSSLVESPQSSTTNHLPFPQSNRTSGDKGKRISSDDKSDDLVSRLVLNKMSARGSTKKVEGKQRRNRRQVTTDNRWVF